MFSKKMNFFYSVSHIASKKNENRPAIAEVKKKFRLKMGKDESKLSYFRTS